MEGIQKNLNPPFFVSMATTAELVQPIPIFLFLSSVKSLSDTFLGDALIKLYETL
jgi:hypothetical protein